MISTGKMLILIWVVFLPLCVLLLTKFISVLGWIAFAFGILKLLYETMKHYGDPHKWLPGYTEKKKREDRHAHYIYHCERNPKSFERLKLENFENCSEGIHK